MSDAEQEYGTHQVADEDRHDESEPIVPPRNPVLAYLPSIEELSQTNVGPIDQLHAVRKVSGVISELLDKALADPDPDRAFRSVAIASEMALREAYGEFVDVVPRLLVTHLMDDAIEREDRVQVIGDHGEDALELIREALLAFRPEAVGRIELLDLMVSELDEAIASEHADDEPAEWVEGG